MNLETILVIIHVVGTILGVGGATLAEIQIIRALKDGVVDTSEKALMHANYTTIRIGTVLVVLSGIALVWWHLSQGNNWVLTTPKVWFKDILVLLIVLNAFLLSKHWIAFWLGSAISFTSWWMATILGLWRGVPFSVLELSIYYVVIVLIVAGILSLIRRMYLKA